MATTCRAFLAVCLLLGGAAAGHSADRTEPKAVIDKAIDALGGAARLTKYRAATWKAKGAYHGLGQDIAFTGEWAVQPPEQVRFHVHGDFSGQPFERTLVVNGDRGWIKLNDTLDDMDPETLKDEKERLFANWVATLGPLVDQAADLKPLGEVKVKGRPAVGVEVKCAGHQPVKLFFDRESGLPVKSETRVRTRLGSREVTQEAFYSDYQEVQGIKHAMKITVEEDGKPAARGEISHFKPLEKLEESTFASP